MRNADRKEASVFTKQINEEFLEKNSLDIEDRDDFAYATRGFIAKLEEPVLKNEAGEIIFNLDDYQFLEGERPDTVNPSLWRNAQLNCYHGLFKVTDHIYQVRGYDIAVITFVESDNGYIVIDTSTTKECAKASLKLLYEHIGEKPIQAIIYTHSHADHWGGAKGITSQEEVEKNGIRIIAPNDFMKYTISENVLAGNAMLRRSEYMFGGLLTKDSKGNVDCGLGKNGAAGTTSLIQPTESIEQTNTKLNIDGVEIIFQLTPGTEAPVEMNLYFPQFKALCMAENCTHVLHNLYTIRGAEVRDAKGWAEYINEAIENFAGKSDVVFATHHWPIWGKENVVHYLKKQRDIYKYIHDQTLHLANQGYTMVEIAEQIQLPESLSKEWHTRGCYGTVNHNSKAVYQKYLGFYDANPANLHPLPPEESAKKYLEYMGGAEEVLKKAEQAFADGDYRWVAQVVNHVIFAEPGNLHARLLQADALEQLGYQAESAPWRNAYLGAALELRNNVAKEKPVKVARALDMRLEDLFDLLAVRINGSRAAGKKIIINFKFTDIYKSYTVGLENAVLMYTADKQSSEAVLLLALTKTDFLEVMSGIKSLGEIISTGKANVEGDITKLGELLSLCDQFTFKFPIVTP